MTNWKDVWDIAIEAAPFGDWAEFGVGGGGSARKLEERLPEGTKLYLFDTFEGLPHDGPPESGWIKGAFRSDIYQTNNPSVEVVVGLFADTLPGFFADNTLSFLHVDCDLYESAKTVLELTWPALKDGATIVFDEMFAYPGWEKGEHKALKEWPHDWEWLYANEDNQQAAIRIMK